MTSIPTLDYGQPDLTQTPALQAGAYPQPRPFLQPFWFLPSLTLASVSWISGGIQILNDLAMFGVLIVSIIGLFRELFNFRRDMGIGGLLLFGGTMVWFCHDYFVNWRGDNFGTTRTAIFTTSHQTVAKGIALLNIFLISAAIGLRFKWKYRVERLIAKIPEPADNVIMLLVVISFLIGISLYFFATTDNPFDAMLKDMFAMRGGQGTRWSVSIARSGNYNYNFGAYFAHLTEVGQVGAILGACYIFTRPTNLVTKLVCMFIWCFEIALAFGTGSRGPMVAMTLPVISIIIWRGWIEQGRVGRSFALGLGLLLVLLAAVQYQGSFRTYSETERNLEELSFFKSQGNMMFSEPLKAYETVPSKKPHPGERFFGANIIRPIPEITYRFITGWIPRALWTTKPSSLFEFIGAGPDYNFAAYYNTEITGGAATNDEAGQGGEGGTVAWSIVGMGYVPYGIPGVIQYGLIFGWLCAVAERSVRKSGQRLLMFLFSMGFATYLFRAFRDLTPHDLYPLVIGTVALSFLIMFLGSKRVERVDFEN